MLLSRATKKYDGKIYWLEEKEIDDFRFGKLNAADYHFWQLTHCCVINNPEHQNKIFIADFPGNDEHYGCSFRLFLYPENRCIGKATYVKESNWAKAHLDGFYSAESDTLMIYGEWEHEKLREFFVCILDPKEITLNNTSITNLYQ